MEKLNSVSLKAHFIWASTTLIIGCILLLAGFIVPPTGVIDKTVLIAFGEICTFVGFILTIMYKHRNEI